jgi:serine/threonine protein kinase
MRWPSVNCGNIWWLLAALQDLQELVSHCLQKEPAERWTARQLLKHRFWKVCLRAAASMLFEECMGPVPS